MFLTKKHLDRRTFLRGMGATVALPLLDAMVPARTLLAFTAARPAPTLAFVYFPHGAIMDEWAPNGRILQPLAPFQNRLTIVSGLENRHAYGPVHAITPGTWLSGSSAREPSSSADQLAADHVGCATVLPSLAVATEEGTKISAGMWQGEYDESYGKTISFRAGTPVPMEFRPRAVFDSLFPHPPSLAYDRASYDETSILDLVAADAASLRMRLGSADRAMLGEYLETIRSVERRVQQAEFAPSLADRMALMFDLIALAFRADLTRVASIMMAAEASAMTYDHLGIPDSFHALSHHQNDAENIDKLVRIQTFHTSMFASFIRTLAAQQDGDGTLLDRSLILYGSNMSNSHAHDHFPLPLAVIGGGCGRLRGGRHLQCPDRTPISNLLLTLLHRADVPVRSIGDSTGDCSAL